MAKRGKGGRPYSIEKRGKRIRATKAVTHSENLVIRTRGTGDSEPEAAYVLAVNLKERGLIPAMAEVVGYVRDAWPSEPAPAQLGIEGAPVAIASEDETKHSMQFLMHELLKQRERAISPEFFKRDKGRVETHILPSTLGQMYVEDVTPEAIEDFFYALKKKPATKRVRNKDGVLAPPPPGTPLLGPSPLRDIYTLLNRGFALAMTRGWIDKNPISPVTREKRSGKESIVDRSEVFAVFDKLVTDLTVDERHQFLLAFYGLRQSERLGLQADSIHEDEQGNVRLIIDRQLARHTPTTPLRVEMRTKTESSTRFITADAALATHLLELKARRKDFPSYRYGDTLLCRPDGRPIRHQQDTRDWHQVLDSRGYPRYRGHLLRHWAATHLARVGLSDAEVKALLGHSHAMMSRHYTEQKSIQLRGGSSAISSQVLPDLAYMNSLSPEEVKAIRAQSESAYRDALTDAILDTAGVTSLVAWGEPDDLGQREVTLQIDSREVTYKGAISGGLDPARIFTVISETWVVVAERAIDTDPDDLDDDF